MLVNALSVKHDHQYYYYMTAFYPCPLLKNHSVQNIPFTFNLKFVFAITEFCVIIIRTMELIINAIIIIVKFLSR